MRGLSPIIALVASLMFASVEAKPLNFTGINEAGAEFGTLPGTFGVTYAYQNLSAFDSLMSKGVNMFRIPFLWERMQPTLGRAFDRTEFSRLNAVVRHITSKKRYVLLDPHNYDKWNGNFIGSSTVSFNNFRSFWRQMANRYKNNQYVIFGLMNEPNSQTTETVLETMQAGIDGIRSIGAKNLITVPGNGYTGAHGWSQNYYGTPNSEVMINIKDPMNNFVYEMHQYLDGDFSGTSATCTSATVGSEQLKNATDWLRTNGKKALLGEFGAGANQVCYDALNDMITYMETNSDVWVGFAYWAAGSMWGDYIFSVEPNADGSDKPQWTMALSKHMQTL